MKRRSLRLRLLGSAAVAIFGALALAWLGLTFLFARHVERRAADDLTEEATAIVAGLSVAANGEIILANPPADPRFGTPASGLYWQASNGGELERSRSLWDQELDRRVEARADRWTRRMATGAFERRVLIVERRVQVSAGSAPLLVQVARDAKGLYIARAEFGRELALSLALLWLVLSLAAWVQVNAGLRPLRRLRTEVLGLKRKSDARLADEYPSEVDPLIESINALAAAREADVRRARQRAADLAHAMKTPIAALSAQSRQLAAGGASTEGIDRAIASVAATVETELARARAAASRQQARAAVASPAQVARRLVAVLERTEKGGLTDFEVALPDDYRLRLDESDLTEILGALLENACRYARRSVRVSGRPEAEGGSIVIDDDGPGMTAAQIAQVTARGSRLDEREGGHGLGISIASELTDATEGTLTMSASPAGGLRVELRWID
ncbi:sensor histidine kinase [Sphingomonas sp. MG17]|uniref:histidine kinase n=1 Tax=Sphingomonas tagetis TaxID=2949092 RepID=A0A9X2HPA5_9SPHN|nr:sensor histidine kinase [Sphingomonas tagetis]